MTNDDLQLETTDVLQQLVRFNTVNPPGNERPAIEYLEQYLQRAGFRTEVLATVEERPNLIADLDGDEDGPTLCFLGHVDTVLADPSEWSHDPWSGDLADGFLWGRGAIDMKSQVAAEAVAGAALAREGWRPRRGGLKLVFVADEETGGDVGARWLTETHPTRFAATCSSTRAAARCSRSPATAGTASAAPRRGSSASRSPRVAPPGHASLPRTGDNALLKLAPALTKLASQQPSYEMTEVPTALLEGLGEDPGDPGAALSKIAAGEPALLTPRRADVRRHAGADDGPRVGQDQRDPVARVPQGRLPRAARARRGRRAQADRRGARRRGRQLRDRVHRAGRRETSRRCPAS